MRSTVSSVMGSIKSTVTTMWNSVKSGISNTIGNITTTIRNGFTTAKNFITNLASSAYNWGADIIRNIVNGIKSMLSNVRQAASDVASAIRRFLHFSVPDEGPLADFRSWMPDFMKGLAKGIEQSKGLVSAAMGDVAAGMTLNPMLAGAPAMGTANGGTESAGLTQQLLDALAGNGGVGGDICIPVYIGQDRIDEIVVTAAQRANYRSGGR